MALSKKFLEEEIKKSELVLIRLEEGKFINEEVLKALKNALKSLS